MISYHLLFIFIHEIELYKTKKLDEKDFIPKIQIREFVCIIDISRKRGQTTFQNIQTPMFRKCVVQM